MSSWCYFSIVVYSGLVTVDKATKTKAIHLMGHTNFILVCTIKWMAFILMAYIIYLGRTTQGEPHRVILYHVLSNDIMITKSCLRVQFQIKCFFLWMEIANFKTRDQVSNNTEVHRYKFLSLVVLLTIGTVHRHLVHDHSSTTPIQGIMATGGNWLHVQRLLIALILIILMQSLRPNDSYMYRQMRSIHVEQATTHYQNQYWRNVNWSHMNIF